MRTRSAARSSGSPPSRSSCAARWVSRDARCDASASTATSRSLPVSRMTRRASRSSCFALCNRFWVSFVATASCSTAAVTDSTTKARVSRTRESHARRALRRRHSTALEVRLEGLLRRLGLAASSPRRARADDDEAPCALDLKRLHLLGRGRVRARSPSSAVRRVTSAPTAVARFGPPRRATSHACSAELRRVLLAYGAAGLARRRACRIRRGAWRRSAAAGSAALMVQEVAASAPGRRGSRCVG